MNTHRHLLILLCLAVSSGCDTSFDVDDASSLAQLDPATLAGALPGLSAASDPSAAEAVQGLAPATAPPANHGIINKVKSPKPEHLIGWVRWANAQPYTSGAVADQTGEDCDMGQEGNIWYLAGTFGGPVARECDVPAGKTLVFPLVNRWAVFPPDYYDSEDVEYWTPLIIDYFGQARANTCSLTLRVDGQEVRPDLEQLDEDFYISVFEPFEIELNDDHWAPGVFEGGVMPSIGDGHYASITPLPPGDHLIELGGEICGESPFSTFASYELHVGPG